MENFSSQEVCFSLLFSKIDRRVFKTIEISTEFPKKYPTCSEECFQVNLFFSDKVRRFTNLGIWTEIESEFCNELLTNMSWMKITCWVELFNPKVFFWWFHELNIVSGVYKEKNPKLWWKFYGRVDKAAFYVSRTRFLEKINFSRSSFVCSFFDFQGKYSDFRKRFLTCLLKKYSTCPEDQF